MGRAGVILHPIDTECRACHLDPHAGRLDARECAACHSTDSFSPANVDVGAHAEFGFALEGAHRTVPCLLCHDELAQPPSKIHLLELRGPLRVLRFETSDRICSDCHDESPHGDQFAGRSDQGDCAGCHDVNGFEEAPGFDHDRNSDFVLGRGHRDLRCATCHPTRTGPENQRTVIYRPIPHRCEDCHAGAAQ